MGDIITIRISRRGARIALVVVGVLIVLGVVIPLLLMNVGVRKSNGANVSNSLARCTVATRSLSKALRVGLVTGSWLRFPEGVRSRDYPSVYFVSAEVHPPASGAAQTATWATNAFSDRGAIFAINKAARMLSTWSTGAHFAMSDDGAWLSQKCVALAR